MRIIMAAKNSYNDYRSSFKSMLRRKLCNQPFLLKSFSLLS